LQFLQVIEDQTSDWFVKDGVERRTDVV